FLMREGTARGIDLAETLALRQLCHIVHGAAGIGDPEARGIGALEHFDAFEGIRLLPDPAPGPADDQPVAVGEWGEAANLEIVVSIIRTIIIRDDTRRILHDLLDALRAALLNFPGGDDGDGSGRCEDIRGHLAGRRPRGRNDRLRIIIAVAAG